MRAPRKSLRTPPARGRAGGYTIVELLLVGAILALIFSSLHSILTTAQGAHDTSTRRAALQVKGVRVLQEIAESVRYLDALPVVPAAPLWTPLVGFTQTNVDEATLTATKGAPETIHFDPDLRQVIWTEDVGGANQTSRVLCRNVMLLAEGERVNLADDNGNGFIDEPGFAVSRDGDVLAIQLSLTEPPGTRNPLEVTFTSYVAARGVSVP